MLRRMSWNVEEVSEGQGGRRTRRLVVPLVPLLVACLGATCFLQVGTPPPDPICANPSDCRLWEAGRLTGVRIGFHDQNGTGGPEGELAAREGNGFTNHGLSWAALQPTAGFVTASMDAACEFSAERDLYQVGYHFAWDQQLLDDTPDWVLEIQDADELRSVLRRRVRFVFERCPGLDRIDVLNEPLETLVGTALEQNHFYHVLGPDYITELFHLVRDEAPDGVELFINENFVEYLPARAEAFVAIVRNLVESGAPIDAVGLQTHLLVGEPDWALYRHTMEQLSALGVKVFVTELDVPVSPDLPDRFEVQAARYRRVVETCLAVPACDMIIIWGIDDSSTWLEWFDLLTGPDPDPLLFDASLRPKPAYFAVRDALLAGRGGDHPLSGAELRLTRWGSGGAVVRLVSLDPRAPSPTPRSTNDPSASDDAGMTIELIRSDGTAHLISVPGGDGWHVREGSARYDGSAAEGGRGLRANIREGEGLDFAVWVPDLDPSDLIGGLRVRLGIGSLRSCLEFGAETVTASVSGEVVAREAARPSGYDCSFSDSDVP